MAEVILEDTLNPFTKRLQLVRSDSFKYKTIEAGHTVVVPEHTEYFVTDELTVVGDAEIKVLGELTISSLPKVDMNTIALTSDTTLSITHHRNLVTVDASSGAVTITLPAAADSTNLEFNIKAIDITNAVTVDADGSETIDGATTQALALYSTIKILCNGTTWWIV